MTEEGPHSPRTVEAAFSDFMGRRDALIKALTTDVETFYEQCHPERDDLWLYGFPDGKWEVNFPTEINLDLPEPVVGINIARDEMPETDWLKCVAVHSDSWLLAVAFYHGAQYGFDKADRECLFDMINDLPTIFEVVTREASTKQSKGKSKASNHTSNKSKGKMKEST